MKPTFMRVQLPLAIALVSSLAAPARASNYALEEIPQLIPASDAQRLKSAGVTTTFQLLERAAEPKERRQLSQQSHVSERLLLEWTQMADIMRIKGVGPDVGRLLAAVGVHTVAQLKTQDAARLEDEIVKVNNKQHLSENPPSVEHLQAWIAQAQTLPIVLH